MAYSEAQKNATMKYLKENYEEIRFRVRKGKKEEILEALEKQGFTSLTSFYHHVTKEYLGIKDL